MVERNDFACGECGGTEFLPLKCEKCAKLLCSEHFMCDKHKCESVDDNVNRNNNNNNNNNNNILNKIHQCEFIVSNANERCKEFEQVAVVCKQCGMQVCMKHRNPEAHNCKSYAERLNKAAAIEKVAQERKEKQISTIQVINNNTNSNNTSSNNNSNVTVSEKNKALQARISLMKLKARAVGNESIPIDSRIFISIQYRINNNNNNNNDQKTSEIFIDKDWVVGKAIDIAISLCKIPSISLIINNSNTNTNIKSPPKMYLATLSEIIDNSKNDEDNSGNNLFPLDASKRVSDSIPSGSTVSIIY